MSDSKFNGVCMLILAFGIFLFGCGSSDGTGIMNAIDVIFDNSLSGLSTANVQDAIDEVMITMRGLIASDIAYDNSTTGLTATNVQDGMDESYLSLEVLIAAQELRIETLENKLASVTTGNDINGKPSVNFNGVNVYLKNGTSGTQTTNGTGNLVIGYNELRGSGDSRTGSHNLIIGRENNYSSYGGVCTGRYNTISDYYSTVTGGTYNRATGQYSSVSGGRSNTASGDNASVSGGQYNTASNTYSSVSGGSRCVASGQWSSVPGGSFTTATASYGMAIGGLRNKATGNYSVCIGGSSNTATGTYGYVSP